MQHLPEHLSAGWPDKNAHVGQHHQRFDTLGLLLILAPTFLWLLINWLFVFSSEIPHPGTAKTQCSVSYWYKVPEVTLTCKNRSIMAMHMYRVSCSSLNLEWTCTSQSTSMARIRPFISLPSKKCAFMDCRTCW